MAKTINKSFSDLVTEEQLVKAIADLEEIPKTSDNDYADDDPNEEDEIKYPEQDKLYKPNPFKSHKVAPYSYKHTMHPTATEGDAVVWIDEEKCKIIVRAPFSGDFLTLSKHLQGRNFVKKEVPNPAEGKIPKIIDKYWEFDLGPENIKELLRVLAICYRKISLPPLDLLWIWDMLETDDIEVIYKIVLKRCDDEKVKEKVDKFFRKHIDISKIIVRAARRIELGDE
jgi:hypothetical protein